MLIIFSLEIFCCRALSARQVPVFASVFQRKRLFQQHRRNRFRLSSHKETSASKKDTGSYDKLPVTLLFVKDEIF